jgi:hypothetical protein
VEKTTLATEASNNPAKQVRESENRYGDYRSIVAMGTSDFPRNNHHGE